MKKRVNITLEDKVIQRIDQYADEHYTSRSGAITIIASAASLVLILSCFQIVRMENQEVLLNKQVYQLASQIDVLEKENLALKKQEADVTISYDDLFARAKSLGMKFPTNCQVQTYTVEKSTAVRVYGEKNHNLGK